MKDYLVVSGVSKSARRVIIMLPDIWGQTDYSKSTLKQFVKKFNCPAYMLDYFYYLTKKPTKFKPEVNQTEALSLMNTMCGEDFIKIFKTALSDIKTSQPKLREIIVIGFCFGGRLAYLAGLTKQVTSIVSFYGAGATKNFLGGNSPLEALINKRKGDQSLKILSFYGTQDDSIPISDRNKIKTELNKAKITYVAKEYQADHAYFQPGRSNYNQSAAKQSWQDLVEFIGKEN